MPAHQLLSWRWLLGKAGLAFRHEAQLRASHRIFVTTPSG
jgi:hypothetical protein